jgi:tRNA nucleotidyltransferase (CCA-adding enzyme)
MARQADLMGADPYPGSTPQAEEDQQLQSPGGLSDLQMSMEPVEKEYKWIYASGQLHVSPIHSHDELLEHSGTLPDHAGPIAAGYVNTRGNRATWSVESNIALTGLKRILEDYGKGVGWKWDGMVGGDGQQVADEFGPKNSVWFRTKKGIVQISARPLRHASGLVETSGKRAEVIAPGVTDLEKDALQQWAEDFGYHLAEYPGGTNMMDRMKNWESLGDRDRGNPEADPEHLDEKEPEGEFDCSVCGEHLPDFKAFQLHMNGHQMLTEEPEQNGHFPTLNDKDDPLPLRLRNVKPTAMPLASYREASEIGAFKLHSSVWEFADDEKKTFYGGYLAGKIVGYAAVREGEDPEILMVYSSVPGKGVGTALMEKIKQQHPSLYSHAATDEGQRLMERTGFVNTMGQKYRYAAGSEPKDLIEAPVPFIYDVQKDHITTGHPGMKTSDIMGQFTPSGIVEGYYEPGGKVVINTTTNMPYSTYHMLQLWYYQHPQMQITSLELETEKGETQKLASADVGSYLKQLTATEPAAWNAYQALRKAGGKVYVVGGAVRDALLQKEPKDIDLLVSGLPSEEVNATLAELPGRVDLTGKKFGVYRYNTKGGEVEVALPRTDVYEESRRGTGKITVNHELPVEKDLHRRDFTVNSMAVDLDNGKLVDPYGGAQDVDAHALRTTHPASFSEDPTRLVRALVASSRHGLIPDEKTRQEMASNASRLDSESPDALKLQLDKLLESPNPAGAIRLAQETGVLRHLFPELANNFDYDQNNPHHQYSLGEHSLNVLGNVARETRDPSVRLAALLHDVGKPASAWIDPQRGTTHYYPGEIDGQPVGADHALVGADMATNRLRQTFNYPVDKMQRVDALVKAHMFPAFSSTKGARKFLNRVGDNADDLLTLRQGDMTGKGQSPEEMAAKTSVDTMRNLVNEVRSQGEATDLSTLAINGNDLISMGVKPGPQLGAILQSLMDTVLENPQMNNPTNLTQLAQEQINGQQA